MVGLVLFPTPLVRDIIGLLGVHKGGGWTEYMGTMKQRMFPDSGTCFKESLRMKPIHQFIASTAAALAITLPLAANAANPLYLNAGAMVTSKINSTIDSGSAHAGDKFNMTVTTPYPSGNGEYASGLLYGHVVQVVSAGQGRSAVLTFAVDRLVLTNGRQGYVNMMLQSQETQRHNNTGNIAMTAVAGMLVGNMLGKTLLNTNLGGAAGLIAGALYANNKKTNVSLRQGSVVVTEVRQTVALNYPTATARTNHH